GVIGPPIPRSSVTTTRARGYARLYEISPTAASLAATHSGVELPIAFGPLMRFTQGEHLLETRNSIHSLTVVTTTDLQTPIMARYRLPWSVWAAMLPGVVLVLVSFAPAAIRRRRALRCARS